MANDKSSTSSGSTQNLQEMITKLLARIKELEGRMEDVEEKPAAAVNKPTIPRPEPYDGIHGDVLTFITQATAYVYASRIPSEHEKILAVGGLLTGQAADFWEPYLRDYLTPEGGVRKD